jgi:plasmid stability protein
MAECRDEGDVDDGMIARVKRQAIRLNRSAEGEHRELDRQDITNEEEPSFDELAADLRKLTKLRKQTPSEVLLREGRAVR